jgi:hypothetical protein
LPGDTICCATLKNGTMTMRGFWRDGFTLRLVGGFILGTIGVVGFHAASIAGTHSDRPAASAHAAR